ncbi:MAG: GGDEF domain-containing protein [Candidatus Metalachnospira sp.]|nr:GGDEF domain-containing protein [Candidatus Metalachnospira sp.]
MKKRIHFILIFITLAMLLSACFISSGYYLPHFEGQIKDERSWKFADENSRPENIELPYSFSYEGDKAYTLSTVIDYYPAETEAPYAFIDMNHMYFSVFIDNKQIYKYTKEDTPSYSKSPGNAYAMIPLPQDCGGRTLTVKLTPTLESGIKYRIDKAVFGDYAAVMHRYFWLGVAHNIIVICILFVGVMLIVLSRLVPREGSKGDTFNIGMFALTVGLYSLSENRFNLYMISNTYLTYLVNFIGFAAIPIPITAFFKNKVHQKFTGTYNCVTAALCLNLAVQTALHFLGIMDLRQLLFVTHICYGVSIILIIVTLALTPKSCNSDKKSLIISVIPVAAGLAIDAAVHYSGMIERVSNTFFLQLGVLFFLIIQAVRVLSDILNAYKENIKSDFYKSLAFKDGLTGLFNRTALNNELNRLAAMRIPPEDLIFLCADINNLKQVNDKYGHEAGDSIICQTADFLNIYLGKFGGVYRIGGDEFTAVLTGISESELQNRIDSMYNKITEYNRSAPIQLDFAVGFERLSKADTISDCMNRADKKMYVNKRLKKENR